MNPILIPIETAVSSLALWHLIGYPSWNQTSIYGAGVSVLTPEFKNRELQHLDSGAQTNPIARRPRPPDPQNSSSKSVTLRRKHYSSRASIFDWADFVTFPQLYPHWEPTIRGVSPHGLKAWSKHA
jgi:hypothetical protein